MSRPAFAALVIIAVVAFAAGCGGGGDTSPAASKRLTDLHDVGQLRDAFNTASGEPRLIVLVSPT